MGNQCSLGDWLQKSHGNALGILQQYAETCPVPRLVMSALVFPRRTVYIIKMEWLALPDELLINTVDNAEMFERIKLISRAHSRRMKALEDQFYTKLLGNKTPRALYKAKEKECAYLISYEAQDGAVHMYFLHEENRVNVAAKLSKWVEEDMDYFLHTQYNDTLTIKLIDFF